MLIFEGSKKDEHNENHLEVEYREGQFHITIENPWAGDTESGFGYEAYLTLSVDKAKELRDFIDKHCN